MGGNDSIATALRPWARNAVFNVRRTRIIVGGPLPVGSTVIRQRSHGALTTGGNTGVLDPERGFGLTVGGESSNGLFIIVMLPLRFKNIKLMRLYRRVIPRAI